MIEKLAYLAKWLYSLIRNRLAQNIVVYALGSMFPQAINILLLPVFTRYLSKSEYGILSYTTALCAFLFVAGNLSIHSYIIRHYFDCKTEEDRQGLFGTIFTFLITYNLLLLGAELLLFPEICKYFDIQVPFEPYVRLALLNNFFEVMSSIPLVFFRVNQEAGRFTALTSSQVILSSGLSLYLVVHEHMGVLGRYYGLLGANAVMFVLYLIIILRISRLAWDVRQLKKALLFSLPLVPAMFFSSLTTMSDRLILERYVSLSQMGIYTVGFAIGYGLSYLTNAIYRAVEPEVYQIAADSDFDKKMANLKRYVVIAIVVSGFIMIALSREVVTLLAAPNFYESYKIAALIAVAMILQGMSTWEEL
jgi:O-antigen/teichoic acid export membrane protein